MTSTAASQQGANKVFCIHFLLILWINRGNSTRQEVFIYSHHVKKGGFRAFIENTPIAWPPYSGSAGKTWKHQQFIDNNFPAFEILLFFKYESSYS